MGSFVSIPAATLFSFLSEKGFSRTMPAGTERVGEEVVFTIRHKADAAFECRCFTSIAEGREAARKCGADAIRVAITWVHLPTGYVVGLSKTTRVNRVGTVEGVLERLTSRLREAYAEASRLRHLPRCPKCGCPTWEDSGRCRNRNCRPAPVRAPLPRPFLVRQALPPVFAEVRALAEDEVATMLAAEAEANGLEYPLD